MIGSSRKILIAALTGLVTLFGAGVASADTLTGGVSGNAGDGNPLSGSYSITTNANGTVTVVLTNDQTNPLSLATMLSDVSFSLSTATTLGATSVAGSLTDSSDHLVVFQDNNVHTVTSGAQNWTYSGSGGNYLLTSLTQASGPSSLKTMIAGNTSSTYCNPTCPDGVANSNFNPYFQNSATFTLAIDGVTSDTHISNVQLSFGTAAETVCSPNCSAVPIPAAVWLFGSGLLGLVGIARRRIRAAPAFALPALA